MLSSVICIMSKYIHVHIWCKNWLNLTSLSMPGPINQPATGSSLKSRVADGCVKVTPGKVFKEYLSVGYCFSITYDIHVSYYK